MADKHRMPTFIETRAFSANRDRLGLVDDDLRSIQQAIWSDFTIGNVVRGTNGVRKLRLARQGSGKSGGFRVFYVAFPAYETVILVGLLSKTEEANITAADRKLMAIAVAGYERALMQAERGLVPMATKKQKVTPKKPRVQKTLLPTFGAEMAAGMMELLDVMESGEPLEKHFRVHTLKTADLEIDPPRRYTPAEIKALREKLNASQALLAKFLGVSTHTVSLWEQGKQNTPRMACRYLDDIQEFPELWTKRLKIVGAK